MGLVAFYELPIRLNTNIILFAFFVSIFIYMSWFTFRTFHRFRLLVNCFCKFLFELIIPCFSNADFSWLVWLSTNRFASGTYKLGNASKPGRDILWRLPKLFARTRRSRSICGIQSGGSAAGEWEFRSNSPPVGCWEWQFFTRLVD